MKKLRIPKGTVKNGLYTEGGKFMTEDYNNYKGYYNIQSDGNIYSGYYLTKKSQRLIKFVSSFDKKEMGVYDKIKTHDLKKSFNVISKKFEPTKKDFQRGFAYRYFCKKRKSVFIVEIDDKQYNKIISGNYSNSLIYKAIKIPWKLKGEMFDIYNENIRVINGVFDTNKRIIINAEKELPGIKNIINSYLEKTVFSEYKNALENDN